MRKIISLILFFAAFMACSAAVTADQAMANAASKIKNTPALVAKFSATASDGVKTSGTLTIAREKFVMETADFGVWYNGEDMWSYYRQNGETSLTTPTEEELLEINPFDIVNQYSLNYNVSLVQDAGGKCQLMLTPKHKNAAIIKALLTLNSQTWLPVAIKATFANFAELDISIDSISEPASVPAKRFFEYPSSKFPGIEVIDLR